MINAYWRDLPFVVQEGPASGWRRVVDTSLPSPDDFREPGTEPPLASARCIVVPRSVVVLIRRRATS